MAMKDGQPRGTCAQCAVNALLRAGQVTPALRARSAAPVLRSVGCSMRGTGPLLSPLCPEGLSRAIASKAGVLLWKCHKPLRSRAAPLAGSGLQESRTKQNKVSKCHQCHSPGKQPLRSAARGDKQEAARKASKTRAPGSKVIERVNGPGRRHVADLRRLQKPSAFCAADAAILIDQRRDFLLALLRELRAIFHTCCASAASPSSACSPASGSSFHQAESRRGTGWHKTL